MATEFNSEFLKAILSASDSIPKTAHADIVKIIMRGDVDFIHNVIDASICTTPNNYSVEEGTIECVRHMIKLCHKKKIPSLSTMYDGVFKVLRNILMNETDKVLMNVKISALCSLVCNDFYYNGMDDINNTLKTIKIHGIVTMIYIIEAYTGYGGHKDSWSPSSLDLCVELADDFLSILEKHSEAAIEVERKTRRDVIDKWSLELSDLKVQEMEYLQTGIFESDEYMAVVRDISALEYKMNDFEEKYLIKATEDKDIDSIIEEIQIQNNAVEFYDYRKVSVVTEDTIEDAIKDMEEKFHISFSERLKEFFDDMVVVANDIFYYDTKISQEPQQ